MIEIHKTTRSRNHRFHRGARGSAKERNSAAERLLNLGSMIPQISKDAVRRRVHTRIRTRLQGSDERPRLNVYRSLNHIYAQVIDDGNGVTLVSASTASGKEGKSKRKAGGNLASAKEIGKLIAQRAKEKGIKQVVFDRGGYLYHGRIKALAEAAREAGLEF